MILSLYIARRFLLLFGQVFGTFLGIMLLIDIIDQSRFFDMQVKLMQKADENANRAAQLMSLTA